MGDSREGNGSSAGLKQLSLSSQIIKKKSSHIIKTTFYNFKIFLEYSWSTIYDEMSSQITTVMSHPFTPSSLKPVNEMLFIV